MPDSSALPLRGTLRPAYVLSLILMALAAAASLAGLLNPIGLYRSEALMLALYPNDLANLLLLLPPLGIALWMAARGRLGALLVWPGLLVMGAYIYSYYLLGSPFGLWSLVYGLILALGLTAALLLTLRIDRAAVAARLADQIPARWAGGLLIALGLLVLFRQGGQIAGAWQTGTIPTALEQGLWAADLLIQVPLLLVAGVSLWRRRPFGVTLGAGLLLQYAALSVAAILSLLVKASMEGPAVDSASLIVLAIMALICAVPCGLILRAAR